MWKDRRNQLKIGEKLFRFLDGDNHHLQQALKEADSHAKTLQLHLFLCRETANWPFELLANNGVFLLPNRVHLVRRAPVRETSKELPLLHPQNRRLRLLFMACSPLDVQSELAFEHEEEAIFKAAEKLAIDMDVEDTGSLEGLREKLEQQTYDIIHLSGHAGINKKKQPFFVMEKDTGYREDVLVEKLWHEGLSVNPPRLLFISGASTGDAPGDTEEVLARMLVETYQIPAVLGWGRWVSDGEAKEAAEVIYKELSRGKSVLDAVQRARYQLVNRFPSSLKPAWPQLRLFSSEGSLDAMVAAEQKPRPQVRRMTHIYLKNSDVKVLGEGFVGRRRQLQQSYRALTQEPEKVGLLILGTGGLGKSCLAGKVSERFKEHTLVIVHGRLNSYTLKMALQDAFVVTQDDHGKNVLTWDMEMKELLGVLCRSCFKDKKYLILLDDFEQNLEGWERGEPGGLLPEAAELLGVLLDLLPGTGKATQLMITCRYGFSLPKESIDLLKERLEWIWLNGFRGTEQKKKVRELPHISKQEEPTTVDKLLDAGCGNPLLMEWIDVLIGEMDKTGVTELLRAVSGKKLEFIQKHIIDKLLVLGGEELSLFLCWFAIYRLPVLKEGAKAVGEKAGLINWEELLYRGMELSLIEHDQARLSYQGTTLLRDELLSKLDNLHAGHEAAFVYYKSICEGKPDEQFDPVITEEWIFHALECGEEDTAAREGGKLVKYLGENLAFMESKRVGEWVLVKKKRALGAADDADLLNELALTISDLGDYSRAIVYYEQALAIDRCQHGEEYAHVASTLNNLGMAWSELGNYNKAIQKLEQAMNIDQKLYGEEHPSVAGEMHNLAWIWYCLGEHNKAVQYYDRALVIFRRVYGEENYRVATTLMNLGLLWENLGDYEKAIDCYRQSLSIKIKVYGDEHPDVAICLNNLGSAWHNLGDNEKALKYYNLAMSIDKQIYGDNHQSVARNLNNQGSAWHGLGQLKKAADYYQQAFEIYRELYGDEHYDVAICLNNLGVVWGELGDYLKSRMNYEQAYAIDQAVYGENHSKTARDLNNLGSVCFELRELQQAIKYFEQAYAIDRGVYGEDHQNAARYCNNLGSCWLALDDFSLAMNHFEKALNIDQKVFGYQHPKVITDLNNIGLCCDKQEDYCSAVDYFEQALAICRKIYEENHPDTATTLINLGSAVQDMGEYQKAIDYYEQALRITQNVYGESHHHIAVTFNNLGSVWEQLGDYYKAVDYYMRALEIDQKIYGKGHPAVSRDLNNLGTISGKFGDHQKAIEYFKKTLIIERRIFGKINSNVSIRFNNMGLSWDALGEHKKAIACFRHAIAIERKVFGEMHHNIAKLFNRMGAAYFQLKQIEKAKKCFKKAYEILNKKFGTEHPQTKVVASNLGNLMKK